MGRPAAADRDPYDLDSLTSVAFELFRAHGYHETSVGQVAAAAGITKSSIYYHVKSKEELLAHGLDRALDQLAGVFDEPGANEGSYVDRVAYFLNRGVQAEIELIDEVTVLLRLRGASAVERRALERRREIDRRLTVLVELAQGAGQIRDDISASLITRLLFSLTNWMVEWYRPDGTLTSE
ncbi:MAG: TetR/AcrR family transcriptional regulator, partial [Ilumatobacter fluminis]